jgi:hypothetical protein
MVLNREMTGCFCKYLPLSLVSEIIQTLPGFFRFNGFEMLKISPIWDFSLKLTFEHTSLRTVRTGVKAQEWTQRQTLGQTNQANR